jgi:hypothetical protein
MNAIKTKFLSATDTRGERIKASTTSDRPISIIRPYNYKLGTEENHRAVAKELFKELDWKYKPKDKGIAYISTSDRGYTYTFNWEWNRVSF